MILFLFVVCMSSFVNCDWGIKTHILKKLHILFLVVMHFFHKCVCLCFFSHPMEALHVYSYIFLSLFYDLTKIHAYFYESLLLCIALQKVFLWYAVIRERRTREAKAQNREKCCLLLFGPLLHSLRQYRWEMRCNQFVCKCHRKMQQKHNWIHVCFYWRLRHLFAVGFLDKK